MWEEWMNQWVDIQYDEDGFIHKKNGNSKDKKSI